VTRQAVDHAPRRRPGHPTIPARRTGTADPALTALTTAPAEGATVADIVTAIGLSRATVYCRLRGHARTGRAVPIGTGRWRPVTVPAAPDGVTRSDRRGVSSQPRARLHA
jgi:hypothetical protein